jgi:hypothetical protein
MEMEVDGQTLTSVEDAPLSVPDGAANENSDPKSPTVPVHEENEEKYESGTASAPQSHPSATMPPETALEASVSGTSPPVQPSYSEIASASQSTSPASSSPETATDASSNGNLPREPPLQVSFPRIPDVFGTREPTDNQTMYVGEIIETSRRQNNNQSWVLLFSQELGRTVLWKGKDLPKLARSGVHMFFTSNGDYSTLSDKSYLLACTGTMRALNHVECSEAWSHSQAWAAGTVHPGQGYLHHV